MVARDGGTTKHEAVWEQVRGLLDDIEGLSPASRAYIERRVNALDLSSPAAGTPAQRYLALIRIVTAAVKEIGQAIRELPPVPRPPRRMVNVRRSVRRARARRARVARRAQAAAGAGSGEDGDGPAPSDPEPPPAWLCADLARGRS